MNAELPTKDANRIRRDVVRMGTTLNAYFRRAALHFLNQPIEERRRLLAGAVRKAGRKVSV